MSTTVTVGHFLLGLGAVVTIVSASLNMATRDGDVVRRVGHVVNAVVGPLVRPFRAFHARLGEPPAARCARRGWHRVNWDGYREVCPLCGRGRYDVVVDDVGTVREEWTYTDDPRLVPGPILPPRSPSGVSSSHRRPDPFVDAFAAEVSRTLDQAHYARPIEYGRRSDPLRRVRLRRDR